MRFVATLHVADARGFLVAGVFFVLLCGDLFS
jgi:hypothetical protein